MASSPEMTAQDRLDVIELIASYSISLDSGELDNFVSNFATHGELDRLPRGNRPVLKGSKAIREYIGELFESGGAGTIPPKIVHFMGLPHIEGNGERCSAKTYVFWVVPDEANGARIKAVGYYTDVCAKIDGRWFFEKRANRYSIGTLD